ncbi:MAG: class I SAM-dependent methyltransferase [Thermotogae bacterium]|nr:class I SAM-dependent methyltransferase [Thermotogota bacterium]
MKTDPFSHIAPYYDLLFRDINYEEWALYISRILQFARIRVKRILEIGCGTGNLTKHLIAMGYEVVGVDLSEGMLEIARKKLPGVEFIQGDVRTLYLGQQYDAVVSTFDSLNNLLTEEELFQAFQRIREHIKEGGIFVGDLNTPTAMIEDWNGKVWVKDLEDGTLSLWRGEYDGDSVSTLNLTLFVPQGEEIYRRVDATFRERGYTLTTVSRLLKRVGFLRVWAFDGRTFEKPTKRSKRITYAAY